MARRSAAGRARSARVQECEGDDAHGHEAAAPPPRRARICVPLVRGRAGGGGPLGWVGHRAARDSNGELGSHRCRQWAGPGKREVQGGCRGWRRLHTAVRCCGATMCAGAAGTRARQDLHPGPGSTIRAGVSRTAEQAAPLAREMRSARRVVPV